MDCNNFYASCERVFRPDWNHRPLGVLSNNDGCIIARSNELKEAGIPMGAPFFKHKAQLEALGAVVVSSNYALYGDMSARVMNTLGSFTPSLEVYSIDEAWLDLTGFDLGTLDAYSRHIVSTTHQHTGIPVSMGIGPTKVLAKVANRICKKRKVPGSVFNLGDAGSLEGVIQSLPVGDVWGVGRRWSESLNNIGIYTALDLRNSDPQEMRKRYNVVMQRLILELRGIPCLHFEDVEPKKEIMASRSFGEKVIDKQSLVEAVTGHAARAAEKLRAQGSVCGAIQVSARSSPFIPDEPYYARSVMVHFEIPTADTRRLAQAAARGMDRVFKPGIRYAKAGVMLVDLSPADELQGGLFAEPDNKASVRLMGAMDVINQRYGTSTVRVASSGTRKGRGWHMKRQRMTPGYTTRWDELASVPRLLRNKKLRI